MYPADVLQKSGTAGFAFEPLSIVMNACGTAFSLWDMHSLGRLGAVLFDHIGAAAAWGRMYSVIDAYIKMGLSVFKLPFLNAAHSDFLAESSEGVDELLIFVHRFSFLLYICFFGRFRL